MFVNAAALRPFAAYLHNSIALAGLPTAAALTWFAYGVGRFFAGYAAHSGLASIHIGLMRQAGWTVPERYQYPFLATSPMDFWRRWNTYIRAWLEAYVFLPLARRAARATPRRSAQVIAAFVTLLVSGLIHDALVFAGRQTVTYHMSELFLAAGALLVVWRLAAFLSGAIRVRLSIHHTTQFDLVTRLSSRLALTGAVVAAAIVWG